MQPLKFLVVDDATFIRDLLKKQLRDGFPGCQVTDVPSALKAQVALKTQRFDLILCDWEMPEMTGEEFLLWLRAHPQHSTLPLIMVTSRGERDFIVKAVQAGVSEYLGKPFKPETLFSKINKVLGRAGRTAEAPRSSGQTQGIAGASIAVLTGGGSANRVIPAAAADKPAAQFSALLGQPTPATPSRPAPPKTVARGQAQLNFAGFSTTCVIKDISLQMLNGAMKRGDQMPALLDPVVISIVGNDGGDVARLNGYVHSLQAGENRIDPAVIKLMIRFVDDDPAKLDLLSRYIEKL
ncbi:MAG: response regulator [Spongiibacteraceae bacterium]